MIWKTIGLQAAVIGAIVAALIAFAQFRDTEPAQNPSTQSTSSAEAGDAAGLLWSPGPEGDARENAAHHWQKHGGEFPELHNEREYIAAAHRFVTDPPPGARTKQDRRGDTLIYDPGSNTFAVRAPDGAPRTMFRPSSGRAYWERQR